MKRLAVLLIIVLFYSSCTNEGSCDCHTLVSSELVRNYEVILTVTNKNKPISNVKLSMKTGESWIPPTETDFSGKIRFCLDSNDVIDSLFLEHPNYQSLKIQLDFEEGNFLHCLVELKRQN